MSSLATSTKRASLVLLGALSLASVACGPEFDAPSEIKTLRVLGVKKDKPYAQPGDSVHLELLAHDAEGRDDIQYAFIGGCVNPPGDLYYGCFAQYAQLFAEGQLPEVAFQDTFDFALPSDVISSRRDIEPGQPRYGLGIVFFAACAGELSFDMNASVGDGSGGLPLLCLDEDDEPLGSDDFVVGYTSIYSFEGVSNQNPTLALDEDGKGRFLLEGKEIIADCVGGECQGAPLFDVDCDAEPERCVEACADDGEPECPGIDIAPQIEQVVERDDVSSDLFGVEVTEQMWVNYYVDHGGISDVRLLNDTSSGWNAKYRAELRAPREKAPFRVWAVAHDNRGGQEFARVTLGVK
jgi:hypothetical protein